MAESSRPAIRIDLNDFKLHLHFKSKTQLTLHFNSPSRRFYLSVIALVVSEIKKLGKIKSISLQDHLGLLALLNESVGGAAGSSDKENLLPRVYIKWRNALPDLEEAPLFKVLGKKKEEGEGATGKIYSFTDAEKDAWANLFDYMGSDENVRLRFAIDKVGVGLDETSIIFGDYRNGEAWDQFISSLKPAPLEVASIDRMEYPLPDGPSIAVLPFVNLSNNKEPEYFSDGMTDDLITDLSKISGLMVIARNSTSIYKGKPIKIKQVAEELGVRYVLEGSVRRAGDEIRINAQFIDAMIGHHLWAERYDGTMGRIFALQDQITQKIVSALAVKLTGAENQILAEKGTNNVEAYDAFLRGWLHYLQDTPNDLIKAVQSFKKAIELDPNYGRTYAALALAYCMGSWLPGVDKGLEASGVQGLEARLRARHYLKQSMKNPTSIAHHVNALFNLWWRQHDMAVSEIERALALDPHNPSSNSGMGNVLYFSGYPEKAVEFTKRAMRLDPHNPGPYSDQLGNANFCMGNLKEAEILFERARRLKPEVWAREPWLMSIHGFLGREKEARLELDTFRKKWGDGDLSVFMYHFPFKDRCVADRFAEGLIKAGIKIPPSGYFPAFKENQLTGKEIERLLSGATMTGIDFGGHQWWLEGKSNGEITWRGKGPIPSDTGRSWIEGDLICNQFQERLWGLESCGTVFRNPRGTYERKDEYFTCMEFGCVPWSIVR
jgi:TolB-like protein